MRTTMGLVKWPEEKKESAHYPAFVEFHLIGDSLEAVDSWQGIRIPYQTGSSAMRRFIRS